MATMLYRKPVHAHYGKSQDRRELLTDCCGEPIHIQIDTENCVVADCLGCDSPVIIPCEAQDWVRASIKCTEDRFRSIKKHA